MTRTSKTTGGQKIRWLIFPAVFLIALGVLAGLAFAWQQSYREIFYPGVKIGYLDVSGMTKEEVLNQLKQIEDNIQNKGLTFVTAEKEVAVNPIVLSSSPDLAKEILYLDLNKTIDQAFDHGRSGTWGTNFIGLAQAAMFEYKAEIFYDLNSKELKDHLQVSFSDQEKPPVNASLTIKGSAVEVVGEQSGYVFDYDKAIADLESNIKSLDFQKINLELLFKEPEIKKSATGSAVNSIEDILKGESITLIYEKKSWSIPRSTIASWLEFQIIDNEVVVGVNKEKVMEFLKPIVAQVNVATVDAKFKLNGNRVSEFQSSRDGKTLDLDQTYTKINEQIMFGQTDDIELAVVVVPAKVATSDLNNLGIKELLGRGVSNFTGSPVNRRHNIKTGVDSLDGILIAPNEEFSLIDALGEIDGDNGYLRELVIKGDRTIPEYGGGLCQIGSTTFRAALWSGLPITARRNHSYRVAYYEPAGMDATIYDPAPDMKFLNDTGHHVLFLAKMVGDDLIFEFYGTPDGRTVDISPNPPSVYNIKSPGPPRYIETDDLAPGEKKKVESAHSGADTYFKYTVTYPNGEIKEEEFYSHYVPWAEVWLIGREATTTTEAVQ